MTKRKGFLVHEYRQAAIDIHYDEGPLEVDDTAPVSQADGNPDEGAYVQAWIWVSDEDVRRFQERQADATNEREKAERNRQ